jgi:uncharacterized protein (DUF2267 family)
MENQFEKATEQAAAFQKIWMESASKVMQAAFTMGPNSPPPEILRQIRTGIFQALANSWEEFMRSPQFLDGMKQWTENAISFRKLSNDFMAKVRNELQAPSREDMDSIMLSIRHVEKRLLDRIDDLSAQLDRHNSARNGRSNKPAARTAGRRRAPRTRAATQKTEVA